MMKIEVKGHSGCNIDIVREDNDLFIYKSTKDKMYIPRLIRQAEKQQKAAIVEYQHVRVPHIYAIDQDKGHASIKMEYVYSRNFIEYFETAGFEQIDYFIKALTLFVEKELQTSQVQEVPSAVTMEKFLDVERKVAANVLIKDDKEITSIMTQAKTIFKKLCRQQHIAIPMGVCHGDLTFSNILFNGTNYYLIDFLDSFMESPLMDIVKIRQDSHHLWSQLMYVKPYDKLRLKIICEKIDTEIDRHFSRYEWYRKYYQEYQLLNLLRILQYAKEEKVVDYLKNEIIDILSALEKNLNVSIFSDKPSQKANTQASLTFSLIVPAAAYNSDQPNTLPYVFSLDKTGIMICIRSIQGLNLDVFDNIYFTILQEHVEKFNLDEMFSMQFKRLGMKNSHLVVLEKPTTSQVETVCQTLTQEHIDGSIFIKDADGFFTAEARRGNGVAIYALENLEMVDPRHKSYVSVDDMYYVTNIIEKRIVSHFFNVGGICMEEAGLLHHYYKHLRQICPDGHLCMSHIVYAMLLDKQKFRPIMAEDYIDYGSESLFNYHKLHNENNGVNKLLYNNNFIQNHSNK